MSRLILGALTGLCLSALASVSPACAGEPTAVCNPTAPNAPGACQGVHGGAANVAFAPSGDASAAVQPGASASAVNSLVFKSTAGNVYNISAVNLTATAGFLLVLDASSVPADGAVTPLGCAPLAANAPASLVWANGSPPARFVNGVVAVLSSGASCYTKTTGTITGLISGQVQ